ncbi:MAG TPA: phosphoadenylyl-sulfate reductase [Actinomycetota bacterium]
MPPLDLPALNARFEDADPAHIVAWALDASERPAVASSFQVESTVVIHLATRIRPDVPVLFLETGFHFRETLELKGRLTRLLGLTVVELRGETTPQEQADVHGPRLYERDPALCCELNKVRPLDRALAGYDLWMTGLRRSSASTRARTRVVEPHRTGEGHELLKVNPVAGWTHARARAYLEEHGLPHHPLYDLGYASIGCAPCTRALFPGEDERAGRWAGVEKVECGIHLPPPATATAPPPASPA